MAAAARIVADIKQRVADGRLRPGERVPSTRQLARDWGVALATAAKALTVLAQEGVVVAEPRVGTIVAEPKGGRARRSAPSEQDLTRERVVRAAVEIADTDGLAELTMRAVADRLGMATMSLYRHVGGKDDLLVLMVDAALDDFALPEQPPQGWRAGLEASARVQWQVYRAHPWVARISSLTRPLPSPGLLKYTEWAIRALEDTSLDATTKMHVHLLAYSYVEGIAANIELERQARAVTGVTGDEWMAGQGEYLRWIAGSRRFPAFVRLVDELGGDFDLDLDRLFEFGLGPLLDGLAAVVEGASR
ncbi:TetR/AcrR family transcriptional regulator C-terminal domain-containing protein [Nonomuraea sp. NPDC046802]|uniref:TetR/AcrR family transcriptional regulator C-terminal domain-containing protein n=1 Tax=Nonomuraea sp. NPDC046802 TaxID=3154919 RepID=UPI00340699CF